MSSYLDLCGRVARQQRQAKAKQAQAARRRQQSRKTPPNAVKPKPVKIDYEDIPF